MPLSPAPDILDRIADAVGYACFVLLLFLVPLAVPPPRVFMIFTAESEIVMAKMMLTRALCALVMACAAAKLLRPARIDWRLGSAHVPLAAVAAAFAAMTAAALASPAPLFSLRDISTEAGLALCALCAPLFVRSAGRVRGLMYATALSAFCVAAIGLLSRAGFGSIMTFLYGADPFAVLQDGEEFRMGSIEGGVTRGPLMSTLANVEYSGSYMAAGFLLVGSWLLDGWGTDRHRRWSWWGVGTFMFATIGAAMVLTATRGAIVVTASGLAVRWLASFRIRGLWIACGLSAAVFATMAFGFRAAGVSVAVGIVTALAWQIRQGELLPRWRAVFPGTRALMLLGAAMVGLLVAAVAIPGPWHKRSLYLVERLAATSTTGDRSVRERLTFLMLAAGMVTDNPVFGVGPGLFPANYHDQLQRYTERDATGTMELGHYLIETVFAKQVHDDYFQVAAERGLLGLAAFLAMMTAVLASLVRTVRAHSPPWSPLAHGIVCILGGIMGNMLTSFPLYEGARLATFYGMVAAAVALVRVASLGVEK